MHSPFENPRGSLFTQHMAEMFRFGLVGVMNTLTTLVIIYLLMAAGAGVYIANLLGYLAGLMVSFTFNRRWTFRSAHTLNAHLVGRFLGAVALSYCANLTAVHYAIGRTVDPHLAQIIGMPIYTICFYLLSKFVVFRKSGSQTGTT